MGNEEEEVLEIFKNSRTNFFIFHFFDKKTFFFNLKEKYPEKSIEELNYLLSNVDQYCLKVRGKKILKNKKVDNYRLLKKEYDGYSFFFDNEASNFKSKNLCPKVIDIKVKCRPSVMDNKLSSVQQVNEYINTLSSEGKNFSNSLSNIQGSIQNYDPGSGISDKQFDVLDNILNEENLELKYIFLDWDRTFTVFEGVYLDLRMLNFLIDREKYFNSALKNVSGKGMAEYFLGGRTRIKRMRSIFEKCKEKNIQIYILTNNLSMDNSLGNKYYNGGLTIKEIIKYGIGYNLIPSKNVLYNKFGNKYLTLSRLFSYLSTQKVNENEEEEIQVIKNKFLGKVVYI